jgi:hypothetical protein
VSRARNTRVAKSSGQRQEEARNNKSTSLERRSRTFLRERGCKSGREERERHRTRSHKHFVRIEYAVGIHGALHIAHQLDRRLVLTVVQELGLLEADPVLGADAAPHLGRVLEDERLELRVYLGVVIGRQDLHVKVPVACIAEKQRKQNAICW